MILVKPGQLSRRWGRAGSCVQKPGSEEIEGLRGLVIKPYGNLSNTTYQIFSVNGGGCKEGVQIPEPQFRYVLVVSRQISAKQDDITISLG